MFAIGCKQVSNGEGQNPDSPIETNEITIAVNGDEGVEVKKPNSFKVKKSSTWKDIKKLAEARLKLKENKEIKEWRLNNKDGELIGEDREFKENTTVFAVSKRKVVSYKVEHLKENIEDDNYTKAEEETKTGEADKNTLAEAKQYEGFTCQGLTQSTIKADGSTVVQIKYERNRVSLILDLAGGSSTTTLKDGEAGKKLLEGKFEARVEVKDLKKEDHVLEKWEPALPEKFPATSPNKTYEAKWTRDKIKIEVTGDGNVVLGTPSNVTVDKGAKWASIKTQAEEKAKPKENFEIKEWRLNDKDGELIGEDREFKENTTVFAISKRIIAQYIVEHLKENIEDDNYTKEEEETKTGEAGENTSAEAKQQYEGFKCQGLAQEAIKADGSTVVQIKYERNRVSLILDLAGGSSTTTLKDGEAGKKLLEGKFEARVEVKDLKKEDHVLEKWEPALPEKFPATSPNKTYEAKWTRDKIRIEVTGDGNVVLGTPSKVNVDKGAKWASIKTQVMAVATPKENFEIVEWHLNDKDGELIREDRQFEESIKVFAVSSREKISIELKGDKGMEITPPNPFVVDKGLKWADIKTQAQGKINLKKYFDFGQWHLNSASGEIIEEDRQFTENTTVFATSKRQEISITLEGSEGIEIAPPNPFVVDKGLKWADIKTKAKDKITLNENFDFVAWHLNNADGTLIEDEMKFEENATVVAVSKRKVVQYKVEHLQENIEDDEFTLKETEEKTGEAGKNTVAEAKQYEGFKCQGLAQKAIKADGSTVVRIKYERNRVSLILDLAGGKTTPALEDGNDGKKLLKGKFGAKVEVKGLEKENYIFEKWEPELPEVFPKENDGKIYVSKWEEAICIKIKGDERVEVLGSENFYVSSGKTFEDVKNKIEEKVKLKEDWSSEDYYFYDWKVNEYEGEKVTDATPIKDGMTLYARTNYRHISFSGTRLIECNSSVKGRIIIPMYVTEIKKEAFTHCQELTAVDFSGCTKLTKIKGFEGMSYNPHAVSLSSLRYLNFTDCTGLESIYRSDFVNGHKEGNYNVPDYQLLTFNLSGCSNLEKVYGSWYSYDAAPMIIKPLSLDANITSFTFKNCALEGPDLTSSKNLSKLEISNVRFKSVVDFSSLTELTEIAVRSCKTNQDFMVDLKNCTKLKRIRGSSFSGSLQIGVRLPNTIEKIDHGAFGTYNKSYCYYVKVPNSNIEYLVVKSGYKADWVLMY